MDRIYHNHEKWECFKHGFFETSGDKEYFKKIVIDFFNNQEKTQHYMLKVIELWQHSVDHFLSNISMNRVAWLGQAACCLYAKVPNIITMYAWSYLNDDIKEKSNNIAIRIINQWEQKKKSLAISNLGSKKDTKQGYQMKLPLN